MIRYSRQRECIKEFLLSRKDHPTADVIYQNVRETYPNVSLGTVYRNLSQLVELGEIQKISCGDGTEHYDPNVMPHYHFRCKCCGAVEDIMMEPMASLEKEAGEGFQGRIESHELLFQGVCGHCCKGA